jgi:predicted nucleic acid-binding protein
MRSPCENSLMRHAGRTIFDTWRRLGMKRYPVFSLLNRVWQRWRNDLSAYDATFVALAELLGCALVTADKRLARAPGSRCPITVVPR